VDDDHVFGLADEVGGLPDVIFADPGFGRGQIQRRVTVLKESFGAFKTIGFEVAAFEQQRPDLVVAPHLELH